MNELSCEQFINLSWISFLQEFTSYNDFVNFILYLLIIFKKKLDNKLSYINYIKSLEIIKKTRVAMEDC